MHPVTCVMVSMENMTSFPRTLDTLVFQSFSWAFLQSSDQFLGISSMSHWNSHGFCREEWIEEERRLLQYNLKAKNIITSALGMNEYFGVSNCKNKKYYIKLISYFHFQNVPKYAQLNLLEVDRIFVCYELLLSFEYMLIWYYDEHLKILRMLTCYYLHYRNQYYFDVSSSPSTIMLCNMIHA